MLPGTRFDEFLGEFTHNIEFLNGRLELARVRQLRILELTSLSECDSVSRTVFPLSVKWYRRETVSGVAIRSR